jgi:DNA-binding MarR family transcriptional regulator
MDNYRELFLMNQIYGTLFSLTNKVQIQGDRNIEKLTSRQFMTMIAIIHLSEDETTINNIARKLGTTKQSVKQLITAIENKGYVVTLPSKIDKRALNIRITELGKKVMKECGIKSMNFMCDLFKDFSIEEMEILWILLKKLYSFDGEEQDGFEENVNFETTEEQNEEQDIAIKEFLKRRNERR